MFTAVFRALLLVALLINEAGAGTHKKPVPRATTVVIFINSSEIKQIAMVREISRQLYYSKQLQKKMSVIFIDINLGDKSVSGPANYIKDTTGLWTEKYRPRDIPALICVKGTQAMNQKMEKAGDFRLCL